MTRTRPPAAGGEAPAGGRTIGRCLHPGCGWHPKLDAPAWQAAAQHVELTGHLTITTQAGR